jgi:hypothetical protein
MSSKQIKLISQRYRIVFGDPNDPDTWTELEAQSITRDVTAAETLFGVRKWGATTDHQVKVAAVTAYYALLRNGLIEGDWASFENAYIDIQAIGSDAVDPTDEAREADSS